MACAIYGDATISMTAVRTYAASAVIFTGLTLACACFAASSPPVAAQTQAAPAAFTHKDLTDNTFVLGRIGVTQIALAHGMKAEAMAGIESALDTSRDLNARNTVFAPATPVMFGRLIYKTAAGAQTFYIPMVDSTFAARVFDDKFLRSNAPDVTMTDAQTVHAHMMLTGQALHAALLQAQSALRAGRPQDAMGVLSGIVTGAVTQVTDTDTPMDAARDNLQLAGLLLRDKSFKAASFAVDHAKKAMLEASSSDETLKSKASDVNRLVNDMDAVDANIRDGKYATVKAPEKAVFGLKKQLDSLSPHG